MAEASPDQDRRARAFWGSFALFEGVAAEVLSSLAQVAVPGRWEAGAMLFARGDPGDWLVALGSGRVRLALGTAGGRELVLRHAGPGEVLGELALFDAAPRSADAVAAVAVSGHILRREAFHRIADLHPEVMHAVTRYLCGRLRETTDQMEGIALYALEARMARFLLFTVRQIHGDEAPPRPRLRLDITQSDLAAVLGATRPRVNQALLGLRAAGGLVRDGAVEVCDMAILRALAEPEG